MLIKIENGNIKPKDSWWLPLELIGARAGAWSWGNNIRACTQKWQNNCMIQICFSNCGNPIADNAQKKKKNYFDNCGNPIAENGKKKLWNMWMSKKKVVTSTIFLQYFHNKSHVINYY